MNGSETIDAWKAGLGALALFIVCILFVYDGVGTKICLWSDGFPLECALLLDHQ